MRLEQLPTPCYIIDIPALEQNLRTLRRVADQADCHILLAQKAFSTFALYPLIGRYLDGCTASGLYEARLGAEEMGKENHIFSPAYREEDFPEICRLCDHIIFNSCAQARRFASYAQKLGRSIGLRLNPECSTQDGQAIYDPCAPFSRLGVTRDNLEKDIDRLIDGVHIHTLCEQDADALETTVSALEEKFAPLLTKVRWINLGGGHHITRPGYQIERLIRIITGLKQRYDCEIYLEPGEAVALNAGYLATTVLDIVENGMEIAILDTSAACHMPDVLEMPYRPPLLDSGLPSEKAYTYRLAGPTCLAGDIIGDYSFDNKIQPGDRLYFADMAIYTMVKNNTFNGMPLPYIAIKTDSGDYQIIKRFSYEDFYSRLS